VTERFRTLDDLRAATTRELGPGHWRTVSQVDIDAFAHLTDDHEWIHVNPDRAARSPFGGTIAHGFLTLSLIPVLARSVLVLDLPGQLVHYGMDHVRFPGPLPSGGRARSRVTPLGVESHAAGYRLKLRHVVEAEGMTRPACVVETEFLLLDDVG
jgi:acyl dehydratase